MEKKLPVVSVLCSAGALLTAAIALALALTRPAAPTADAAYRAEKCNEVNDRILDREIVPEDYLRYLPDALVEPVKQYNADTASLKSNYEGRAAQIAASLLYEHSEDPGDYQRGDLFYTMADHISTSSLFRDVQSRCLVDPVLCYTLSKEAGGSAGMWPYYMEQGLGEDEGLHQQRLDYLDSVDALLDQFDAARTG